MSDDLPDDVAGRLAAESALRSFAGVGDRADSTDVPALEAPPPAKKTAKAKREHGHVRVVSSERVDADAELATQSSQRPKRAKAPPTAVDDDVAQLSDGLRTLLDWLVGVQARRTYEASPLGQVHTTPADAMANTFDALPPPTSPSKPALPATTGHPGAGVDPEEIESNPLFSRIRNAMNTPQPQRMRHHRRSSDLSAQGKSATSRPVAERLVGSFFWLSVLPLCCIIWGAYVFPEVNRSNKWAASTCEVLQLQTDLGAGPACHVRAAVRLADELGGWTVETVPAPCYRDWGCREGNSAAAKRAACQARYACGGNGTHPAPGCMVPCFQNSAGIIPQVALENLYDIGEMGMFLCAMLVPVMLLVWLRFWGVVVARVPQPPTARLDEEAPCACDSLTAASASLQCCRSSRNGVMWPVAVLASLYLVLALAGMSIVIDAADSFTQCAVDGVVMAPAALEVMMAALLFVYALAPVAPAQRPDLLLQFAVAPRLLQLVLAFVSLVAVGTATGEGAYACSNHRLYVYEFLFSVANMLLAGLVLTYFVVFTPLTGYALPPPDYHRARRSGAGGLAGPPRVCPCLLNPHTDYRTVAAVAMVSSLVFSLVLVAAATS